MNIPSIFWFIPAAAVIALLLAWAFYRAMKREDEGTPRMREIAGHVRRGAMAYLRQQYKVVAIVFVVLALFFAYLAYGAGVQNPWVPFAFLTGGFFSGLANEVLMLAYMNRESMAKTLETGYTWFYSRSRQTLWNKGATSGHTQKVISMYADCDDDTLLVKVVQTGAACHTGSHSCFYKEIARN